MFKVIRAGSLLVALTLGMAACDTTNNATSGASQPKISDSDLKNAIKTKIDSDAQLKAADIGVSADGDDNTATLSGTVETQAMRTRAVDLARSAHAGLIITDKIDVKPRELTRADYTDEMATRERERATGYGEKVGDSLDDAWIHTKIVSKLIAKRHLRPGSIDSISARQSEGGLHERRPEKGNSCLDPRGHTEPIELRQQVGF